MENKIPAQREGAESNAQSEVILDSDKEAIDHFEVVKRRFLDINNWNHIAGKEKAEFLLRDGQGNPADREPQKGDYVSIKVPLLHNDNEDGCDWIRIEEYDEEQTENGEKVFMTFRPSKNPLSKEEGTAHFLDDDATNSFLISREDKKIIAEVHARNETPNKEDEGLLEKIRNKVVAIGGMILGSKIQWESLTNGLVKYEK